jgi:aminopeptidase N
VEKIWATRDSKLAQEFVSLGYPSYQIGETTLAATDGWLAEETHPAPLRRLVAEGKDGILRALRAQRRDEPSASMNELNAGRT